ncbi:MAG: glucose-6-phosphate isomerase [Clostridiales bacterium]|jgi:glucose-6-phosphate isomerase|nr:glucose-6-phosphate isomerase [Clostridiales bacterium]
MKLDFNNMMAEFVGPHGITPAAIAAIEGKIGEAVKAMEIKRPQMQWRDLPHNQGRVVEEILEYVAEMSPKIGALVVLGIGGSALGPIALQQALNSPFYNLSDDLRAGRPQLFVLDNIDPATIGDLFAMLDLETTLFSVVSKSGATSETMSQFMIVKQMLEEKFGKEGAAARIVCTTDKSEGNLIKIAQAEGYKTFVIPSGVGGRFSQLCPVGLLPAAFCGLDIRALLAGAAAADSACQNPDFWQNPAYIFAILHYLALKDGKNISVMMPYADSLKFMADWYAQLWAESLGKKFDNSGREVFVGQTPVKALGATDQHSQVQLYAEGPFDKVMVFLGVEDYGADIDIPETFTDMPSLGFLGGHSLAKLLKTQQMATEYALLKAGRPNMTISLPEVNEYTMGQLFYILEVATAFAGELLEIDAFDQPGVEEGKNATYAYFGRPGYEAKKAELNARPAKSPKYIC